jgi:F420-non-reducing hydrogenase iron-sulfur subunit
MNRQQLAKVYVFCCSNSFDKLELIRHNLQQGLELKVIPLPCSGKLDILYLTKAFESGADGAAVMICRNNECQYVEGNRRAIKRAEAVGEILEEIGVGKDRVTVIQMNGGGTEQAIRDLEVFCLKIRDYTGNENHSQQGEIRISNFGNAQAVA